ncbi:MAG: RNA polymerase sigma-70 factor [Cytophagales bacterium]|nr:RNA polymerase sigma-70 factor [Bernardetiaceae bacterium]MDW8210617.1 RNA polymerase sigma-70 factor [Cytophagales bacterium]
MKYAQLSDEELLQKLAAHDAKAFEAIYTRYARRLFAVAVRKVALETAQEIVQEVFVRLWQNRTQPVGNLAAYLLAAVRYGLINHFRHEWIKERFSLQNHQQNSQYCQTNECFLNEIMQSVEQALSQLPAKTQLVFRMSRFEGFSNKEIAQQLAISEKAVEYHITQSLKVLRQYLKPFLSVVISLFKLLF